MAVCIPDHILHSSMAITDPHILHNMYMKFLIGCTDEGTCMDQLPTMSTKEILFASV
eukprot:c38199_g1_i1 orf=98-268(+)